MRLYKSDFGTKYKFESIDSTNQLTKSTIQQFQQFLPIHLFHFSWFHIAYI
jgi:hypothetical protein